MKILSEMSADSLKLNGSSKSRENVITADIVGYIDLLYHILGYDITYDKWQKMTEGEKVSYIRDLKLNKIFKNE